MRPAFTPHLTSTTSPAPRLQGFEKLREPELLVRVRQVDESLVKEVLESAAEKYAEKFGVPKPDVSIDTKHYLAPPPDGTKGDEGERW